MSPPVNEIAVQAAKDREDASEAAYAKLPRGTTPAARRKFADAALELRAARKEHRTLKSGANIDVTIANNDGSA